jgi:triosephosphate isomerase (TIM)
MRKQYLIANWKLNVPPEGVDAYFTAMRAAVRESVDIVVAPPFPFLGDARALAGDRIAIGGQNCAHEKSGAFTGEVSAAMLKAFEAGFVILGHSERRTIFGEHDPQIARKLALALSEGLVPVLCIGEDLKVRDSGHVGVYLADQIKAVAGPWLDAGSEIVVAYEPIWAIGTGRNASGAMVAETVAEIRHALERFWPAGYAEKSAILYGGSVTPDNVADLVDHGTIDGFLVGGASLDSGKFSAILRGMKPA